MYPQPTTTIELWIHVPGFPGYEVSSLGRLRSTFVRSVGSTSATTRVLSTRPSKFSGRVLVSLRAPDGAYPKLSMQRLVLLAFVGPCPEGMEACHNNGLRADNRLSNLRWDTHLANCADKLAHGTNISGERHALAKLTNGDVERALALLGEGLSQAEVAAKIGSTRATVGALARGVRWASVVGDRKVVLSAEQKRERDRRRRPLSADYHNAVLDDHKVALLRYLRAVHEVPYKDLSVWFGVTASAAQYAASGRTWGHVPAQRSA